MDKIKPHQAHKDRSNTNSAKVKPRWCWHQLQPCCGNTRKAPRPRSVKRKHGHRNSQSPKPREATSSQASLWSRPSHQTKPSDRRQLLRASNQPPQQRGKGSERPRAVGLQGRGKLYPTGVCPGFDFSDCFTRAAQGRSHKRSVRSSWARFKLLGGQD